jgi:hypothetical protein
LFQHLNVIRDSRGLPQSDPSQGISSSYYDFPMHLNFRMIVAGVTPTSERNAAGYENVCARGATAA